MPHYFVGRLKVGDPFEVNLSGHTKIRCEIFQRWKEKQTYECSCGLNTPFKVTRTWGVSEKDSEILESSVGGTIGVKDVAELKSKITATSGHEIEWTYTKAEEMSFVCDAPECGWKEIRIYQLVYEYELVGYSRGYLFKRDVWDREWTWTIPEEIASYSCTCDTAEFDERCKNCTAKPSPEFEGRLSVDLGPLSLLLPYKMNKQVLDTRVGKFGVRLPVEDYQRSVDALEGQGLKVTLGRKLIDPALLFLSGLQGEEFEGNMRIYWDDVVPRRAVVLENIVFETYAVEDFGHKGSIFGSLKDKGALGKI